MTDPAGVVAHSTPINPQRANKVTFPNKNDIFSLETLGSGIKLSVLK